MEDAERLAVDRFFAGAPWALPLFEAVRQAIGQAAGTGGSMTVQKTQIAFRIGPSEGCRPLQFAFVWLPLDPRQGGLRRIKGRPEPCLAPSFGLGRPERDPRILSVSEPYPGRFTHHMLLAEPSQVDEQVRGWLREAADFAREKQRRGSRRKK